MNSTLDYPPPSRLSANVRAVPMVADNRESTVLRRDARRPDELTAGHGSNRTGMDGRQTRSGNHPNHICDRNIDQITFAFRDEFDTRSVFFNRGSSRPPGVDFKFSGVHKSLGVNKT